MAANLWAKGRTSLLVAVAGVVTLIASNSFSPKESIAQSPKDGDGSGSPSITTDGAPKVAAPRKSIDEIFAEIATKAPGFGGAFLSPDPSETAAFVYLTDPSQEKLDQFVSVVQRDYGSELGPLMATTDIRAVQGKYDYVELKNWYDLAVARTVGVKGVRTTDIQEGNNRLEFGVKTEEARSEVLAILKEIGVPDDATFVLTTTDPVQPLDSLQGYYRPLIGGLQIESAVSQCTLGFQAVIGGVEGFFTAHHCTANRGSVSGEYFDQPTWNSYQVGAEYLDPPFVSTWSGCSSSVPCRYTDSSFIRKDSGVGIMDGFIARAADGAPTWDPNLYNLRIDRTAPLYVNDRVFKVGRTTGLTNGQVFATCVNFVDDSRVHVGFDVKYLCMGQSNNMTLQGGDSGSAVFKCSSAEYPTWNCPSGSSIDLVGIASHGSGGFTYFGSFQKMVDYEYGSIDAINGTPGGGGGGR